MMSTHADFNKRFNRNRSFITWAIRIIFVAILAFWIAVGYGGYKIYKNLDFSHGLKGVVEQVWYGNK